MLVLAFFPEVMRKRVPIAGYGQTTCVFPPSH